MSMGNKASLEVRALAGQLPEQLSHREVMALWYPRAFNHRVPLRRTPQERALAAQRQAALLKLGEAIRTRALPASEDSPTITNRVTGQPEPVDAARYKAAGYGEFAALDAVQSGSWALGESGQPTIVPGAIRIHRDDAQRWMQTLPKPFWPLADDCLLRGWWPSPTTTADTHYRNARAADGRKGGGQPKSRKKSAQRVAADALAANITAQIENLENATQLARTWLDKSEGEACKKAGVQFDFLAKRITAAFGNKNKKS